LFGSGDQHARSSAQLLEMNDLQSSSNAAIPRWLRLYYVLAAVTAATILGTLYLTVRVMRTYDDAVAVDHDWDMRREHFDSLTTLAFEVDEPVLELIGATSPRREGKAIDSAYGRFEAMMDSIRGEVGRDVPRSVRGELSSELDSVDGAMKRVAEEADSLIDAWVANRRATMSKDERELDHDFMLANALLARARDNITRVQQVEFNQHRLVAGGLHRNVQLLGAAALLMMIGLALFGRRLTAAANENAARRLEDYDALEASESRYRALAAELEQRVDARTEQLREARAAAESASRAKSEFLANMSHEIRTPMNGVLGMLELSMDTELTPLQKEYVTTAYSSAESLLSVINDILDFSKIESGRFELDPYDFDLVESLADTVSTLAMRAQEKGLELSLEVDPDVPPAVHGDLGRLRQIIINLVGNAIKFTERGEVSLRVSVEPGATSDVLHFAVRDTGIGIPADKQRMIFEAFRQADTSTTRQFGGTGLGLAISTALVEMMQGRIWVESDGVSGSTFHFTASLPEAAHHMDTGEHTALLTLTGLKALVVDDNETNRRILSKMLEQWQMQPTLATNGKHALEVLADRKKHGERFDLIITDADMPELDGFGLVERVRQQPDYQAQTVLMLSSVRHRDEIARCRALGVERYLTKPIRQSQLRSAIVAALGTPATTRTRAVTSTIPKAADDRRLRVLVAEDNTVNQKLARALLERAGHHVVVAENGQVAVDLVRESDFDVILMDVQMPVLGGFEATRAIREWEQKVGGHIPIIAVTARAMAGDREDCLAAGMDGYVAKPLRAAAVFEVIESLVPAARHEAAPAQAPASGIFDRALLLDMLGDDQSLFAEITDAFFREAPLQVDKIRRAMAGNDPKSLREAAHSLKGAAATITAARVASQAERIEAAGRESRTDVQENIKELENALTELRQVLDGGIR
jgi:signal transduction histidine kinase/DNA-binding response OmpR family regulator